MKHPITKFPIEPYEEITEEFVQRKYYENIMNIISYILLVNYHLVSSV